MTGPRIIVAYDEGTRNIDSGLTIMMYHNGVGEIINQLSGKKADLFAEAWKNLHAPISPSLEMKNLAMRAADLLGDVARLPDKERNGLVALIKMNLGDGVSALSGLSDRVIADAKEQGII